MKELHVFIAIIKTFIGTAFMWTGILIGVVLLLGLGCGFIAAIASLSVPTLLVILIFVSL